MELTKPSCAATGYDADDLRMRFFERLSKTGRLDAELLGRAHVEPGGLLRQVEDAMNHLPSPFDLLGRRGSLARSL